MAELLEAYGVADAISYDLAEVRDLDYYTGVTFEGFAPGLGFSLISGGRYDDLIGHFGPPCPAVGWALTLDRILLARGAAGGRAADAGVRCAAVGRGCTECLAWAAEARRPRAERRGRSAGAWSRRRSGRPQARTAHPARGRSVRMRAR